MYSLQIKEYLKIIERKAKLSSLQKRYLKWFREESDQWTATWREPWNPALRIIISIWQPSMIFWYFWWCTVHSLLLFLIDWWWEHTWLGAIMDEHSQQVRWPVIWKGQGKMSKVSYFIPDCTIAALTFALLREKNTWWHTHIIRTYR